MKIDKLHQFTSKIKSICFKVQMKRTYKKVRLFSKALAVKTKPKICKSFAGPTQQQCGPMVFPLTWISSKVRKKFTLRVFDNEIQTGDLRSK